MQIIEILIRIWGEYAVVEFTDTNEVELVPVSWITSDKKECFWPNFRSTSKQKMAVRQGMLPNSTEFKKFVVKIMYQTKDYEKARKKLKEAECKSDLQTEAEEEEVTKKRTKRPNPKYDDSESSDSDSEIRPQSPKKKKKTLPTLPTLPALPPLPIPPSPAKANGQNSNSQDLISSGNFKARTSEFELKVLKGIEQMRLQMQHNTTMLQLLLKKVDLPAFQDEDEDQSCLPNMPITSLEQFNEVNEAIKNDDIRNRMIRKLGTIGGDNIKQSVRRVMASILNNDVAKKMNWLGRGGKKAFSISLLKDVLLLTVRKNRCCRDATDKDIEDAAKDWLRYSCDRDGGRKDRKQKKAAEEEQESS